MGTIAFFGIAITGLLLTALRIHQQRQEGEGNYLRQAQTLGIGFSITTIGSFFGALVFSGITLIDNPNLVLLGIVNGLFLGSLVYFVGRFWFKKTSSRK